MSVLLIDTYSLFFRAFFALPVMTTRAGQPTQALYGLSSLLLKLLREEQPEGVAFALDRAGPTFRHAAFPEYKGTRAPLPSPLAQQLVTLERLLDALAFPRFSAAGFEADDVIATLAEALIADGREVLIASGDRDLLQLVGPHSAVLFLGRRGKPAERYDEGAVRARFGIPAERLPVYAALVGDNSDNVPKVKGIGPVAASKLAAEFADVETMLREAERIEPEKLRAQVRAHAEQLRASEQLVRLRRDVPLPPGPHAAPLAPEAAAQTRALFEDLEFQSLLPRLDKLVGATR